MAVIDTSGLQSGISALNAELNNFTKSLKASLSSFGKSSIDALRQQISQSKAEYTRLESVFAGLKSQQDAAQNEVKRRQQEVADLDSAFDRDPFALADAQNNLTQAEIQQASISGALSSVGEALKKAFEKLTGSEKDLTDTIESKTEAAQKSAMQFNRVNSATEKYTDLLNTFNLADTKGKFSMFFEILTKAGDALINLRESIYKLQLELGTTFPTAIKVGIDAFTNRISSFFSGGPILSFQDSIDAINAFQKEFGGLLTRGDAQRIAQASKDLGVSAEVFLKAQRNFLVVGGDVTRSTFIGQFRAAGLTAANALQFAAQNANLVAIAGNKYADELARAAANAQRIGVSLSSTEKLADGIVGDFEGALERFSELRAMGVEVDFNRLASVAGTGTPEEVLSELQSQLGGNQQLLTELQRNRFLKVALERDLGLNVAEITKLAAGEMAVAPEETREEETRGLMTNILERAGTLVSAFGKLGGLVTANTFALVANTLALTGGLGGLKNLLTGGFGRGAAPSPQLDLFSGTPAGPSPAAGAMGTLARTGMGVLGTAGVGLSAYGAYQAGKKKQVGGILLNMLSGAASGAMVGGAVVPGAGAIPGAIIGALLAGGSGIYGAATAPAEGMARGGLVRGPGTATSDSILTPLSDGEFVINAKATQALGVDVLTALNSGARIGYGLVDGGRPTTKKSPTPVDTFTNIINKTKQIDTTTKVTSDILDTSALQRQSNKKQKADTLTAQLKQAFSKLFGLDSLLTEADILLDTGEVVGGAAAGTAMASRGLSMFDDVAVAIPSIPQFLSNFKTLSGAATSLSDIGKSMMNIRLVKSFPEALGKTMTRAPIIGSLIGGIIDGVLEYRNTDLPPGQRLPSAIFKGLFTTIGALSGAALGAMTGNPFIAAAGGVAGSRITEKVYDAFLRPLLFRNIETSSGYGYTRGLYGAGMADVESQAKTTIPDFSVLETIGRVSAGKAQGGLIQGKGTTTSDSILTPLSNGEFIINAAATKRVGVDVLSALNSGALFGTGMADGGLVGSPSTVPGMVTTGVTTVSPGKLAPERSAVAVQPEINNVVNVNMNKLENTLSNIVTALSNMHIEMEGNTVGRVSLNSRSPLDALSIR